MVHQLHTFKDLIRSHHTKASIFLVYSFVGECMFLECPHTYLQDVCGHSKNNSRLLIPPFAAWLDNTGRDVLKIYCQHFDGENAGLGIEYYPLLLPLENLYTSNLVGKHS